MKQWRSTIKMTIPLCGKPAFTQHPFQKTWKKVLLRFTPQLIADGDISIIEHLSVDRVDYCTFANSKPFRIRIINSFNDTTTTSTSKKLIHLEFTGLKWKAFSPQIGSTTSFTSQLLLKSTLLAFREISSLRQK